MPAQSTTDAPERRHHQTIDRRLLCEALVDAFPELPDFKMFLEGIGRNWWMFAGLGTKLPEGVLEVIEKAIAGNWLSLLLHAVETSGSRNNPKFVAFLKAHPHLAAELHAPGRERYLKRLLAEIAAKAGLYSPLELTAQLRAEQEDPLLAPWADEAHLRVVCWESRLPERTREEFTDALEVFAKVNRAVLLGAPGAGKSTTLRRHAADLARKAQLDEHQPVPILVPLGTWRDERPLEQFVTAQASEIADSFQALADAGRLVILLDGLNEMDTGLRKTKAEGIRRWIAGLPARTPVVVSCRVDDYRGELELGLDNTLTLQELKPWRVREVLRRWLGSVEAADALFWGQLAGDRGLADVLQVWLGAGSSEESFWSVSNPEEDKAAYRKTSVAQDELWRKHVGNPRSLVRLAANPFLLTMLFHVWRLHKQRLPDNRTALVQEFVNGLLARERLLTSDPLRAAAPEVSQRGQEMMAGLTALAWRMQTGENGSPGVLTVATWDAAVKALGGDESLVKQALDTNLLDGGGEVRFVHQLLQEYFAALALREEMKRHPAAKFWPPDRWWERSGWEETAVLLAGFYPKDVSPVLRWLGAAQPEVAARCAAESGAVMPAELKGGWKQAWLPRLTDVEKEPRPEARAALGRALGRLGIDDRKGVGVKDRLPDIDWVRIPGGTFVYQEGKQPAKLDTFFMARYPVTNAQFDAFLNAEDGYQSDRWWKGLTDPGRSPAAPRWHEPNHPRETVSWHEAMAFCAWLSHRVGFEVRLPTEREWERAARGTEGREYPWGNGYQAGSANVNETWEGRESGPHYLGRTSAVGMYPQGASVEGVMDLAGNVWEWCLNEHEKPQRTQRSGGEPRVLRGGSWYSNRVNARAAYRDGNHPYNRYNSVGFRVVCSSPIR